MFVQLCNTNKMLILWFDWIRTDIAYGCQTDYDNTVISKLRQQRRPCTTDELCVRFPWNRLTIRTLYKIRAYFLSIYFIKHIRVFFCLSDLSKRWDFIWKKRLSITLPFFTKTFYFSYIITELKTYPNYFFSFQLKPSNRTKYKNKSKTRCYL